MLYSYQKNKIGDLTVKDKQKVYKCIESKKVYISQDQIDDGVTDLGPWENEGYYYEIKFDNITSTLEGQEILKEWQKVAKAYDLLKDEIDRDNNEFVEIVKHFLKYELKVNGIYYDQNKDEIIKHFFTENQMNDFYKNEILWAALGADAPDSFVLDLSKTRFKDALYSYDINSKIIKEELKEDQKAFDKKLTTLDSTYLKNSCFLAVDKNRILYYVQPAGFYGQTIYDIYTDNQPVSQNKIDRITELAKGISAKYIRLEKLFNQLKEFGK